MAENRAGGILMSSFVAGALLAAAIFAPSAWEPVPGPYFGLDEQAAGSPAPAAAPDPGMEAAHAELSARANAMPANSMPANSVPANAVPANAVQANAVQANSVQANSVQANSAQANAAQANAAQASDASAVADPAAPVRHDVVPPPPVRSAVPPERVAVAETTSVAAVAALAGTLPVPVTNPATTPTGSSASVPDALPFVAATPEPVDVPPESLKAMITRRQAAQPATPRTVPTVTAVGPTPADQTLAGPPPIAEPMPEQPVPVVRSSSRNLSDVQSSDGVKPVAGNEAAAEPDTRQVVRPSAMATGSLGAAPLPGGPWTDPDAANWSEIPAQPTDAARRRGWLGERGPGDVAAGQEDDREPRPAKSPLGGRILERLRPSPRVARLPGASGASDVQAVVPPDIGRWPRPVRLEQQFTHLGEIAAALGQAGESLTLWIDRSRVILGEALETRGPRDAAADSSLVALGEHVLAGMSLADTTADAGVASHTRRAALAIARRVAVWRATAALCADIHRGQGGVAAQDAADAMTRQAAGRTTAEVARLLDAIERFETEPTAPDASVVRAALGSIAGFYPSASHALLRAVDDHYVAPNVRIAVHQHFMEKLMPEAAVDTGPFQDVVMGREVRGTRRVERTTTLRLMPDDDEISFHLEVHGDIASRSTTESGPVSVTARSASAFTVRKPIKISSQGLLFGNAAGTASNRSHVDAIQTSFDSVPMMGSLVRNIAKNQQAEAMPEANREVIDKIVSRACREIDSQSEPQFAELAQRVRDKVWMPLVNLGLDPTAVAMETSSTQATMRLRLASATQLAAHTPRPRAPADAMLSLQVHESSVNNVVDRLALAGRRQTLEELIRMVCAKVGAEPRIPDELPEGVTVQFADVQPLRVECRDGLVHVRVTLDAIESGRRDWLDIVAHVAYRPVCNGPQVFLERDGPIRLSGPGHEGRMELALRTIFGKIFPKERPIALLPEKIVDNPRLAGAQAVQAVSSDGWLAIALQQVTVAQPAEKPAEKRAADVRRKVIFR
jgi:hypothetical protein